MNEVAILKEEIRKAFKDIEFPCHCGIRAAIAMDDWISDPDTLREITSTEDIKAEWWQVPSEEFKLMSLAACYFDSANAEFYLPAFMVYTLDNPIYANCYCLITWLTPLENNEECAFYDRFLQQFSKIEGAKKSVCINVIKYISSNLPVKDWSLENEISEFFASAFWRETC